MSMPAQSRLILKTICWTLVSLLFLAALPLLRQASLLVLAAVAVTGAGLGAGVYWLVQRLRQRRSNRTGLGAALAVGAMTAVVGVAAPLYWLALQPALAPLTVPRVTLTDGHRQVIFQGMTHIGSAQFYRSVAYDVLRAQKQGYALYFEGVLPGTPQASEWFGRNLAGGGDLNAEYAKLATVCGLHFQNEFLDFLVDDVRRAPSTTINADVSETEMMQEWERRAAADPLLARRLAEEHPAGEDSGDSMQQIFSLLSRLDSGQQHLAAALCRGIFTVGLSKKSSPDVLNVVVLDFRNARLAQRITDDADRNLFILYGSGHFPGLLKELRSRTPAWRVKEVSWSIAIDTPEQARGTLQVTE